MAYMRGERLCGVGVGVHNMTRRWYRTRALLLDAISAGQVVLEDVRAARLAGLRTVARERLFLRSGARRAANCGKVWFRGSLISGREAQHF